MDPSLSETEFNDPYMTHHTGQGSTTPTTLSNLSTSLEGII